MEKQEKICRLCLNICNTTCKVVENNTTKIVHALLECDLTITKEAVMCTNCTKSVKDCSNFKLTCLGIEDFIVQFNNRKGNNAKLDLKEIYLSKMTNGVPEDHDVCRLCMSSLRICSFISLNSDKRDITLEKMMLEKCIPQLDLCVTKNPVICVPCHKSLLYCFRFMTNCLMVEEKIKRYCDAAGLANTDLIKLKDMLELTTKNMLHKVHKVEMEYKCYEDHELVKEQNDISENMLVTNKVRNVDSFKTEDNLFEEIKVKIEVATENLKDKFCENKELLDEHLCNNELLCISENLLTSKGDVKKVDTVETEETFLEEIGSKIEPEYLNCKFCKDEEDVKEQECTDEVSCISENISTNEEDGQQFIDESKFIIKYKGDNQIIVPKIEQLYCQEREDEFETDQQNFNSLHVEEVLPQTETNINLLKREECSLKQPHWTLQQVSLVGRSDKTSIKKHWASHNLNQKNSSQIMYQCKRCPFLTKYKSCLTKHNLIHTNLIKRYQCKHCLYKTNYKDYLQKHLQIHKDFSEITINQCEFCSFQTKYKRSLQIHLLMHKNPSEVTMYQCEYCSFQTKYKGSIKYHLLSHKNLSEITMYQCDDCSFQTKYKRSLKIHLLMHKNPSEITMYQCEHCSFQTKRKGSIKYHLLSHKNISEIAMYQCEHCSFETKYKRSLKNHLLSHKNPSDITMYQCEHCSFQAKLKEYLKKHLLNHKNPSEITMYQCEYCLFQTKRKGSLKKHLLNHTNPLEICIPMYECEHCSFQTKRKGDLKSHLLIHKNPSEITMNQCEFCSFQTKRKISLKHHLLMHKNPSEITMYQCDRCSFQTKYKGNLKMHLLTHYNSSKKSQ